MISLIAGAFFSALFMAASTAAGLYGTAERANAGLNVLAIMLLGITLLGFIAFHPLPQPWERTIELRDHLTYYAEQLNVGRGDKRHLINEVAVWDIPLTDCQICDVCRFGLDGRHPGSEYMIGACGDCGKTRCP